MLVVLFLFQSCVSFETSCGHKCELEYKGLKIEDEFSGKYEEIKIKPRTQQIIPVHYLYTDKNRKGLLINHFVGTGKTYLSIFFSELYDEEKVVIIAPSYLEAGWIDSLKNFPVKNFSRYEFVSYADAPKKLVGRDFSKTILLMDEAHNLTKFLTNPDTQVQSQYTDLYLTLQGSYKILALTATPIQEDESDIAYLLNLVSGETVLPVNREEFRIKYTNILKNMAFWRGHISESLVVSNIASLVGLAKMIGFLTFIPAAIGSVGVILPLANFVFYPVHKFPLRKFDPSKLRYYAGESISFSGYTSSGNNKDYPDSTIEMKEVLYTPAQHRLFFSFASQDLKAEELRLFFPQFSSYSDEKFLVLGSTLLSEYRKDKNAGLEIGNLRLKDDSGDFQDPPKFQAILKTLQEPLKKTVVYSLFKENGIELFVKFLDENGFKNRYEVLSSAQSVTEQREIIKRYNTDESKLLLLHPEISEGIDLKGTRQMHFLEPIGNNSHFEQVQGRSIRYISHAHLPLEERHVQIYVWKAMLDDTKGLFEKGGSYKWFVGSSYRHEDFNKRHPELNYYSSYGDGKSQVDKNHWFKRWSPDEQASRRFNMLKESSTAFYEMLSKNSVETHYKPVVDNSSKNYQMERFEMIKSYRKRTS